MADNKARATPAVAGTAEEAPIDINGNGRSHATPRAAMRRPPKQAARPRVDGDGVRWGRRDQPMLYSSYRRGTEGTITGRTFKPEPLNSEEVLGLLEHCGRGASRLRNCALIAVMWRSGLRRQEALDLRPQDIDFKLGAIRILHGKNDRDRLVHLDDPTAELMRTWLKRRRELGIADDDDAPLFCTYEAGLAGRPLWPAYVNDMLRRAARNAGIQRRVHPHGLRHTFAWDCRIEGWDLATISEALGHEDIGTTYIYLKHLAPIDRIREMRKRAWPTAATSPSVTRMEPGGQSC